MSPAPAGQHQRHARGRQRPEERATRIGWPVWRLAWVIVFGAFASGLDASLANIGLHAIAADLHADLDQVQWVASGYLLALAVSLPACGWLGRKAGVGRLWLAALAGFTAASGLCAAAPTIGMLIGVRVGQGLAAGVLIPAGQTILGQAVGPGRLGRVMSTLGMAVSLAPAIGPVVGGVVLHWLAWQWLFLLNLPIGAAGLALGWRLVPRGEAGQAAKLDWLALICASAGLALVVYALTTWGSTGDFLSPTVLATLALGAGSIGLFVRRSRRADALLDLRLYRNRVYTAASAAAGFTGAVVFGSPLLFPLYFQLLHHDQVIGTGLRVLALGIGTAIGVPAAGRLTDRYGGGRVAVAGTLALVAFTVPFAFLSAAANPVLIEELLLVLGMATGLAAVPPGIAAYTAVTRHQLPDATTGVNIIQRLGGALGAAMFAVVLARGLPAGVQHAFHAAFWWQAGAAVAALGCALWLWLALRHDRASPS